MTRKETVINAIKFRGPERVPLLYNNTVNDADIIGVEVLKHFTGPNNDISEWGFKWEYIDRRLKMGQPKNSLIKSWEDLDKLVLPDPYDKTRFEKIQETRKQFGDERYYRANFSVSGFATMTFLRGFSELMEDLYLEREQVERLADIVFGFEEEIIKQLKANGYDAVGLADDWGTQQSLFISPKLWREIFKPRYKKQIDLAHEHGLDVYLHSCGYIYDIIPDLIEIGLDILNPGQPFVNNVKKMGENFGGKICFSCPVSYQTTSITGSKEEIYAEVKEYVDYLGCYNGGLIGIILDDYESMGITKERQSYIIDAFKTYGRYRS